MAIRDSFPVVIADGDQLNDGYFVGSDNYACTAALRSLVNHTVATKTGLTMTSSNDGYYGGYALGQSASLSYVDTTNSTCVFTQNGLVAAADVLDNFLDSSVNAAIWASSVDAGAVGTITEGTGIITLSAAATSATQRFARVISSGASGLNLMGSNCEVILDASITTSRSGGGSGGVDAALAAIQISNGTTHVNIFSQGITAGTVTSAFIRIVYDNTNNRCDVWTIDRTTGVETLAQNNLDLSSVTTNRYIRFTAEATLGSSSTMGATVNVYGIGYRKHGASAGNAEFVTPALTVPSSSHGLTYATWRTVQPLSQTSYVSFNGGSNYSATTSHKTWVGSTAGTSAKAKIGAAKPTTITVDVPNIPLMNGWGMLYG